MKTPKNTHPPDGLTPAWEMDVIQFPRLLAEIGSGIDFNRDEKNSLSVAMDLPWEGPAGICGLFERAQRAWDVIRADTLDKEAPRGAPYAVVLDHRFRKADRGNIWLVHEGERRHNAWIRLQGTVWLEIAIRACNHPGLIVQTINCTRADLTARIRQKFGGGWTTGRTSKAAPVHPAIRRVHDLLYLDMKSGRQFYSPNKARDADTMTAVAEIVAEYIPIPPPRREEGG